MTLDDKERAIGWRSIPGDSSVMTSGRVNFKGTNGRTRLDVVIEYAPPAGPLGEAVSKIFSDPDKRVEDDLKRFRDAMETGAKFGDMPNKSGESYGSSMGGATESELNEIDRRTQA